MADNFSFVFQDIGCGFLPFDVLDTKKGTLVHTPIDETESITLAFQITKAELKTVYEKIVDIEFFEYPSEFTIPSDYFAVTEVPISAYSISVTNGEITHHVSWTGFTSHTDYPKANQLFELIRLIEEIIQIHPEYQELPPATAGCA